MTETAGADGEGGEKDELAGVQSSALGPKVLGRHRRHQFPAREYAMKVLYAQGEWRTVEMAAELRGLRPSSYVGEAALEMAERLLGGAGGDDPATASRVPMTADDAALMAELIQARLALRRFGVNVNQAVAAIHSGAPVPLWLEQAVEGGTRAVARVDAAAAAVARRFG